MKCREPPKKWDVRELFPGKLDQEIGELVADFFYSISTEYDPVREDQVHTEDMPFNEPYHVEAYQVSGRLKAMRKPASQVHGDIPPRLVTLYHDLLALPQTHVFNQVFATDCWPKIWALETVIIIPKKQCSCLSRGM